MRVPRHGLNCALLSGLWLLMMALRQNPWLARDTRLLFGFLPAELAYQAGYSLLVAGVMALLVRFYWPAHLEPTSGSDES